MSDRYRSDSLCYLGYYRPSILAVALHMTCVQECLVAILSNVIGATLVTGTTYMISPLISYSLSMSIYESENIKNFVLTGEVYAFHLHCIVCHKDPALSHLITTLQVLVPFN